MAQDYRPSNIGWEFMDTPNPREVSVAVTSEITGMTAATLRACIMGPLGRISKHLRQMPPPEFASYVVTHYKRLLPGTLTFFCVIPKTDAMRRTAFNSTPLKKQWSWDPILTGGVLYQYDPAKFPLSATLDDGSVVNVPRMVAKALFQPSFSGPCGFILNEYLSEVPFPEDMVNGDDPPVPRRVAFDFVQQEADFGKVLLPFDITINLPDPENYKEIARFGKVSDSEINLKEQNIKKTNVGTWVEYVVSFEVARTDGEDKGQYYGRELVALPPPLPKTQSGNSTS